jgi:hypothetical protein
MYSWRETSKWTGVPLSPEGTAAFSPLFSSPLILDLCDVPRFAPP